MPGAASFKRVLDGAPFTDARARRAPLVRSGRLGLVTLLLGSHVYRSRCAARPTRGSVGVVGCGEPMLARALRRSAPAHSPQKESVAKGCLWKGSAPPNGSRLSCGASAGGRKHPALWYELAGAQTYASSEGRPRQLQALVRQPLIDVQGERAQRSLETRPHRRRTPAGPNATYGSPHDAQRGARRPHARGGCARSHWP